MLYNLYRKITVILFCCAVVVANAYADDAAQILQDKLNIFSSLTANFKQTVITAEGDVLQRASGSIAIQRPGKFRWETKQNVNQLIVTNGKKIWIYDPDLQQVTIQHLSTNIGETPILLLTSSKVQLKDNFFVSKLPAKGVAERFKLEPKNKNENFMVVDLSFVNNKIKTMQFANQLGQKTILNFSNVELNRKLGDVFTFKIPHGVDVIDQTKVGKQE